MASSPAGVTQSFRTINDGNCLHLIIQTKNSVEILLAPHQADRYLGIVTCEEIDKQYNSATYFPSPLVHDIYHILRYKLRDCWYSSEEFEATWTILESMMNNFLEI